MRFLLLEYAFQDVSLPVGFLKYFNGPQATPLCINLNLDMQNLEV